MTKLSNKYNNWKIISPEIIKKGKTKYVLCKCCCEYCQRDGIDPIIRYVKLTNIKNGYSRGCDRDNKSKRFLQSNPSCKSLNKYDLTGEYGIGYIRQKNGNCIEFLFDIDDYDKIKNFTWYISSKGYIYTVVDHHKNRTCYLMHRLIMNIIDKSVQIDHINGSKTDNRKCNLRVCTSEQNDLNRKYSSYKHGSGVFLQNGKWMVRFQRNGTRYYGGVFDNYEEALLKRAELEPNKESVFQYNAS